MADQDFISEIMGFDPSNLSAFQENEQKGSYNENIYKTNPVKGSKSEDGHYHSKIKILYNPFNPKRSIINQCRYTLQDEDGYLFVDSCLSEGDKSCRIFKSWKKLWFSGDDKKKEWAKKMYDKTESRWVLVQIMEDNNQPDLVGKFKLMKLPISIYNKLQAKMHPTDPKKTPIPMMDYLIGPVLEMDVTPGPDDPSNPQRKLREISYDLCEFETDFTPIMMVDGTPLFDDDEMEVIEEYARCKADVTKAKTEAKKEAAQQKLQALLPQMKPLYEKAIAYLKEEALDVDKEIGWKPWSDEVEKRVDRWIEKVLNMEDPKSLSIFEGKKEEKKEEKKEDDDPIPSTTSSEADAFISPDDDSLPF